MRPARLCRSLSHSIGFCWQAKSDLETERKIRQQLRTELSDLQKEVARQGDKHEARMATATSVHRSLEARLAESQAQLEEAKKLIGALEREVAELREVAV